MKLLVYQKIASVTRLLNEADVHCPSVEDFVSQMTNLGNRFQSQQQLFADPKLDPLLWWKENGHKFSTSYIHAAVRLFLAIPASSAPSERVFSGAGNIFSKRRRAMESDQLSALVFVRENAEDEAAVAEAFTFYKKKFEAEEEM